MNDKNLLVPPRPGLPIREERRRRSDRRSSDPAKRDRRRANPAPWTGPERRRGPRRIYDRRKQNILRALLATLLCMLCLAAPPDLQADNSALGCLKPGVMIEFLGRAREAKELSLARCDGSPNMAVLDEFSVHVRPRGAELPEDSGPLRHNEEEGFVARDIRRFDARVLSRLQEVAERWPGHRIVVVSAYRPGARVGSRHHHAQAIDISVEGVHRAEVAEFARALPETGVGFYPSSTFTHIDVRIRPSFWVDQSEPGERSRYVPNDEEDAFFAAALAELPSRNAVATATEGVSSDGTTAMSAVGAVPTTSPSGASVSSGVAASAEVSTARAAISARNPTLRRDVQRTLREGLSGAFEVAPSEPTASMSEVAVSARPASMRAASMRATASESTTERVRIAAPATSEPAPIDWGVPW